MTLMNSNNGGPIHNREDATLKKKGFQISPLLTSSLYRVNIHYLILNGMIIQFKTIFYVWGQKGPVGT